MTKKDIILGSVMIIGAAAWLLLQSDQPIDGDDPDYQAPDLLDQATAIIEEIASADTGFNDMQATNLAAFLWMIRVSEGTAGAEGYRTMVGGSLFDSYADHPRVLVDLPRLGIKSSAAGAYQILRRTWDGVAKKLGLVDFSPASQDAAALELIRQRGALAAVREGRFADAVGKCRKEWASLPGAGYGQHENTLSRLMAAYEQAGGVYA